MTAPQAASAAERLYSALLTEVVSGSYTAGMRFLSNRLIMTQWRVSAKTTRQALEMLRKSRVLRTVEKSGHYLTPKFRYNALQALREVTGDLQVEPSPQQRVSWRMSVASAAREQKELTRIAIIAIRRRGLRLKKGQPEDLFVNDIASRLTVEGITQAANAAGVQTTIHLDNGSYERTQKLIQEVLATRPQGVIIIRRVVSCRVAQIANALLRCLIPVVTVYGDCEGTDMVSVNFNDLGSGLEAARVLMRNGHRNLAVAIQRGSRQQERDRANGFERAVREAEGCRVTRLIVSEEPGDAYLMAGALARVKATAIFTTGEESFRYLWPVMEKAGIRVPEDVSMIICSCTPEMSYFKGKIDIIHLDFESLGRCAFGTLVDSFRGRVPQRFIAMNMDIHHHGTVRNVS